MSEQGNLDANEDISKGDTYEYVSEKVKTVMKKTLESQQIDAGDITYDSDLTEFGINSILFIKIIVDLETMFDFEFDDDDLDVDKFIMFKDLVDYIIKKTT